MKNLVILVGIGAMAFSQVAHAQNALSSYSQAATATAGTSSYDYRYTQHISRGGGSGRGGGGGGHTTISYSWDPYLDQTTTLSLPLTLGLGQQITSQGTFYGPTYSATAAASSSLTNTPKQAVLTVNYAAATTVTTPLAIHQSVTVMAQPGGTFTFTITHESDVTVSTTGDPNGAFRLFGYGAGVLLGLSGTSGQVFLDTPLPPGTYWVDNGLTYSSNLNTQSGTSLNPGTTSTAWGFTLTITPTDSGGSGGSGGGGGGSGGGGGDTGD